MCVCKFGEASRGLMTPFAQTPVLPRVVSIADRIACIIVDRNASSNKAKGAMTDREPALKKRRKARNRVDHRLQQEEQPPLHNIVSDADELTQRLPFCCASCHCDTRHPERLRSLEDVYPDGETVPYWISPADGYLDHLKCCHGVLPRYKKKELAYESPQEFEQRFVKWAPPVTAAIEEALLAVEEGEMLCPEFYRELESKYRKQIEETYTTAKAQETEVSNDSNLAAECQRLLTNADYQDGVLQPFQRRLQSMETGRQEKKAAVVLDAFAGIGTGVLCLKRLGIDMRKVIHIEHDKVATWVYQVNHNAQEDGIEHVYEYSTWEDLVGSSPDETYTKLEALCDNHGPIDIVIGGPPCIEFSKVNSYAQGTQGEQGKYLLELGRVVRAIERIQSPHPLYFLAENVVLSGAERETVDDAFGLTWDPINLNSQDFSPARRNRHFWTNIPCNAIDYTTAAARVVRTKSAHISACIVILTHSPVWFVFLVGTRILFGRWLHFARSN